MIGWKDPLDHVLLGTILFLYICLLLSLFRACCLKTVSGLRIFYFLSRSICPFKFYFLHLMPSGQVNFKLNWNFFERPYWILWYLLGMMVWTTLTHFLIKTKFALPIALILALCIGFKPLEQLPILYRKNF